MARRRKPTHPLDAPGWKAAPAARAAHALRQQFVADTTACSTYRSVTVQMLQATVKATIAGYENQGHTYNEATKQTLLIMNCNEPIDDLVAAIDNPTWWLTTQVITSSRETMRDADLYVPDPDMHSRILAATAALEFDDLSLLQTDDLPTPLGVVVFDEPVIFQSAPDATPHPLAAISWRLTTINLLVDNKWTTSPAVVVTGWESYTHPINRDIYSALNLQARAANERMPTISPVYRSFRAIQPPAGTRSVTEDELASVTEQLHPTMQNTTTLEGAYTPGDAVIGGDITLWLLKYVMATARLIAQPRQAQARAFGDGVDSGSRYQEHHDVRVIAARPATSAIHPSTQPGPPPKYSHRWPVRMHKVRYWFASEQVNRIGFRGPFIKGPEGTPIIETPQTRIIRTTDDTP